jgi:glycosyltransferase involved in cell wall biosynthesis
MSKKLAKLRPIKKQLDDISKILDNIKLLRELGEYKDAIEKIESLNIEQIDKMYKNGHLDLYFKYYDELLSNMWYSYDNEKKLLTYNKFRNFYNNVKSDDKLCNMVKNHIYRLYTNLTYYLSDISFFDSEINTDKTIVILCYQNNNFYWDDTTKCLNGSEEAVVYISDELVKLGYRVIIFGNPNSDNIKRLPYSNPQYVNANEFNNYVTIYNKNNRLIDNLIIWRQFDKNDLSKYSKKTYLWIHDIVYKNNLNMYNLRGITGILWLSDFHRMDAESKCPYLRIFESNEYKIYGNGVLESQFSLSNTITKKPFSCIYASNYVRGLEILLDIWPDVKKEIPEASLNIYYGWNTWCNVSNDWLTSMKNKIKELELLDVKEHGSIDHINLAKKFTESEFWLYPCTYPETFCITALKAQLAGAIPIYHNYAALNDTVAYGYNVDNIKDYKDTVIHAMKESKEKNNEMIEMRKNMRDWVLKKYTWGVVAKRWDNEFTKLI